jgi:hypothetical protein
LLACVTGQIDEALRQKLEFVLEENHVYRALLERHSPHWRLQDAERKVLAEKGKPVLSKYSNCATLAAIFSGIGHGNGRWRIEDGVAILRR